MLAYLKIKIKSLAAEAQIIRHSELGFKRAFRHPKNTDPNAKSTYLGLRYHRTFDVRREARASLLAYAFLRGRKYRDVEEHCHEEPSNPVYSKVLNMVLRYGHEVQRFHNLKPTELKALLTDWFADAEMTPRPEKKVREKVPYVRIHTEEGLHSCE